MMNFRDFSLPVSPATVSEQTAHSPEDLPGAVERLAQTDGWEAGLALQTAHWDRFIATHPEALLASLTALPGEAYVKVPSLLIAANYLQHVISGDDPRRFHDFAHDEHGRSGRDSPSLDRLIGSAGRTAGHRTAGRLRQALQHATDGRRVLDGLPDHERAKIQLALPHLLTQWGRAFEVNDAGGFREYEEAWEVATLSGQPLAARRAAASLAWLHADHGELNQADTWLDRARAITTAAPRYDAPLHLAAALTAIDRLDRDGMLRHLEDLRSVPIGEYWAAEAWVRAWAADSEQEAILVEKRLNQQTKAHPRLLRESGSFRRYLTASHARLAATRHRMPPQLPQPDEPTVFDRVMVAAAAYRTGKMHAVLREAAPAAKDPTLRMQACGQLLTAAARLSLGRAEGAAEAFSAAYATIEDERLLSAYSVIDPEHLAGLSDLTSLPVNTMNLHAPPPGPSSGIAALATLTRRERQILVLLASGQSLKEIADDLFISPNTVKGVTSGLYRKLDVHSRHAAADLAHRAGLV